MMITQEPIVVDKNIRWSIQTKALTLIAVFLSFTLIVGIIGVWGTITTKRASDSVVFGQVPLMRSIQEALSAMTIGQLAVEKALDVDTLETGKDFIDAEMNVLLSAAARFNMFMAAITWGSDSEAFARSQKGENLRLWREAGFAGTLMVPQAAEEEVQLGGQASIYFEGFVNHAKKAMDERKAYLGYLTTGEQRLAEESKQEAKTEAVIARGFADNVVKNLRLTVAVASESVAVGATEIGAAQTSAVRNMILVGIAGLITSLLVAVFASRVFIIRPIGALIEATEKFSAGDLAFRSALDTGDELEMLGRQFNGMADRIGRYTQDLEHQVEGRTKELNEQLAKLNEVNKELDKNAALLLKRDSELTRANERLRELDKAKTEFLSIAAHQLRTPLSAIKWVFSVILEEHMGTLSSEQKSYILKGEESNNRMIRLVDDMLTVTRIESGKTEYHFYSLSLKDVLASLATDFTPRMKEHEITFSVELASESSTNSIIDPEKIRFVFENLLENAIRYTPPKGVITLMLERHADKLIVKVSDTGIGIPAEEQKHIFTKFFRAANAVKKVTDGSGLGLFVAKTIVERHGGSVGFTSTLGEGTTFTVELNHADSGILPEGAISAISLNAEPEKPHAL